MQPVHEPEPERDVLLCIVVFCFISLYLLACMHAWQGRGRRTA